MDVNSLLDSLLETLTGIDESLIANDLNTALRKTHECMVNIKKWKEESSNV